MWLILALAGCTEANLYGLASPEIVDRQRIRAEVCAPADTQQEVPYKVLFVIDTSLSNGWNDPDGKREAAVADAIDTHIASDSVSFGIITFSDEPRRQTYGYTRDLPVLEGATENVGGAQGGTNYSDTLWEVIDFVMADVDTLTTAEAAESHYLIFWLSDGIPTVGVTEPEALLPAVSYLRDQLDRRVAELTLHTAFLGAVPDVPVQRAEEARQLLLDMALDGEGTFTDVPAGSDFAFDFVPQLRDLRYELSRVVARNRHARFSAAGPAIDSDADWLTDALEQALGTDPLRADTDGDGLRDGVERAVSSTEGPLVADVGCGDLDDEDEDGLTDCEELVLGTARANPDTDGDFLMDGQEVAFGASAVSEDAAADGDHDGLFDREEVPLHLDPRIPNSATEVAQWAYRYEVEALPQVETSDPRCYQLRIDNLTMVETLADDTHPAGGNIIDLVVAFTTDGDRQARFQQVQLQGRALPSIDRYEPPHGRFDVLATDFEEVQAAVDPVLVYEQTFVGSPGEDPPGWIDPGSAWALTGEDAGVYRVDPPSPGVAQFDLADLDTTGWSQGDLTATATVRHSATAGARFGLVMRVDGAERYRLELLTEEGKAVATLWRDDASGHTLLGQLAAPLDTSAEAAFPMAIAEDRWLGIAVDGADLFAWVDDAPDFRTPLRVLSVSDPMPLVGTGVGVESLTGAPVMIDALRVTVP